MAKDKTPPESPPESPPEPTPPDKPDTPEGPESPPQPGACVIVLRKPIKVDQKELPAGTPIAEVRLLHPALNVNFVGRALVDGLCGEAAEPEEAGQDAG